MVFRVQSGLIIGVGIWGVNRFGDGRHAPKAESYPTKGEAEQVNLRTPFLKPERACIVSHTGSYQILSVTLG